ncbi:MAG TPA: UDP-N-acetylmuramoyl-tripeptide--D-alanyl-D-alanine ligase [Pyrinomonadaceae bacterium]|nr:UDP-N-acetylmuramoyl-tripeptide--D-alanyl-D-alanine ligase [Pyrinomonadaceae bacterium]HMP67068.1 UDP-N-acetylmuramoyl-tripeptide--D-alanyl-D-alanine ligase [Pyrinomonadaceae bacterium]
MELKRAIDLMNADASELDPALAETDAVSFFIDSRDVLQGGVFFALSQPDYANNGFNGDFDDATRYVPEAFDKGTIACVVRRDRYSEHRRDLEPFLHRLVFVDDTIAALQRLAGGVYADWGKPVVAITGSAGKTTAKELTAHVLSRGGHHVLRNIKNYNNGIGHPLTVLKLIAEPDHDIAVLEMGMSTPMHEIERLCRITPPDVSVVLNVLPVHLEHLGSIERIAEAKAEIVAGMKPGGTAVLNADDPRVLAMSSLSKGSTVTFGVREPADIMARGQRSSGFGQTEFTLVCPSGEARVKFPLDGLHNVYNALAAAAVGLGFGMNVGEIADALTDVGVPEQRGEILRFAAGFTVINDSYNSNPDALLSMAGTLVEGAGTGRKIVVAGEMLELGTDAAKIHEDTGRKLASMGIDVLIGVRGMAESLVLGAKGGGSETAIFCVDSDEAGAKLTAIVQAGDVVLVKGSRGVRTEKVVEAIRSKFELEAARSA